MGHDVISIHDPSDCESEPTLDDLMGELIGESDSESVSLINYPNQMDEILSLLSPEADKELTRIVKGLKNSRDNLLPCSKAIENILDLQNKNPIASPLLQEVIMQIRLFNMGHNIKSFRMKPLLVVGKPGIGKTYTMQRIAKCLELEYRKIDISMGNEAFFLSGTQRGYANTTPGEIARHLSTCISPNPLFILDELDKGMFADNYRQPMTGPLLALLERDTASRFYDASLRLDIDTSHISWMATANDVSKIPKSILSRFIQVEFDDPTPEHMKKILCSVSSELLKERCLTHIFIEASTDFIFEAMKYTGRELKHVIDNAIVRHAHDLDDHYTVKLDLIDLKRFNKKTNKRPIGFIY